MWKKHETYWENLAPQKSLDWELSRFGRINSSNTAYMAEDNEKIEKTVEKTGKVIAGLETETFKVENQNFMNHGNTEEPNARKWYEKQYNVKVLEMGHCIPFFDLEIGASVDGKVYNLDGTFTGGIIEIKCPQKMYKGISTYMQNKQNGWKPPANYYEHIFHSHHRQMLQGMKVLNAAWCDYIVYCTVTKEIFVQRVYPDDNVWIPHYKKIKENYDKYVRPYLPEGYPIKPSLTPTSSPPPPIPKCIAIKNLS
jgi:hypothetical protein